MRVLSSASSAASLLRVLFLFALAATPTQPLSGQVDRWTSIGPSGGLIQDLFPAPSEPSRLYAVSVAHLLRSRNRGRTWTPVLAEPAPTIAAIAFHPQEGHRSYLATGGGALESRDWGLHWRQLPLAASVISGLQLDPEQPDTLFTSASTGADDLHQSRVLVSEEGGGSWAPPAPTAGSSPATTGATPGLRPAVACPRATSLTWPSAPPSP